MSTRTIAECQLERVGCPDRRPVEGWCAACGAWVVTGPPGTPWLRGRCGNRSVDGVPGRRCRLYAQTQRFVFGR